MSKLESSGSESGTPDTPRQPLSKTAQAIAMLVGGAGERGIPRERLAPMLYMADVLSREYLGAPITGIEWTADMFAVTEPYGHTFVTKDDGPTESPTDFFFDPLIARAQCATLDEEYPDDAPHRVVPLYRAPSEALAADDGDASDEEAKLVAFFNRTEGIERERGTTKLTPHDIGREGDHDELTPAETAIRAMENLLILASTSKKAREFFQQCGVL